MLKTKIDNQTKRKKQLTNPHHNSMFPLYV